MVNDFIVSLTVCISITWLKYYLPAFSASLLHCKIIIFFIINKHFVGSYFETISISHSSILHQTFSLYVCIHISFFSKWFKITYFIIKLLYNYYFDFSYDKQKPHQISFHVLVAFSNHSLSFPYFLAQSSFSNFLAPVIQWGISPRISDSF